MERHRLHLCFMPLTMMLAGEDNATSECVMSAVIVLARLLSSPLRRQANAAVSRSSVSVLGRLCRVVPMSDQPSCASLKCAECALLLCLTLLSVHAETVASMDIRGRWTRLVQSIYHRGNLHTHIQTNTHTHIDVLLLFAMRVFKANEQLGREGALDDVCCSPREKARAHPLTAPIFRSHMQLSTFVSLPLNQTHCPSNMTKAKESASTTTTTGRV